ncbi:MAG: hypothetical protein KC649_03460, partial [Candidatus Omnitrophica bacterium]|nr:hypothetical protein [Candidatus Omnitrophota bacterium]
MYYAQNNRMLMKLTMDQVIEFKRDLPSFLDENFSDLLAEIRRDRKLTDSIKEGMEKAINQFITRFIPDTEIEIGKPPALKK